MNKQPASLFLMPARWLIQSNLYISLAAVALTIQTQIQLGMKPQGHPYVFIIFFATLLVYNLHRLILVLTRSEELNSDRFRWVRENLVGFYLIVGVSVAGLVVCAFLARREVLVALAPVALLTLFYSLPVFGKRKGIFSLRQVPYLKIFLIALVWSAATIVLPLMRSEEVHEIGPVLLMLAERFFFVFAITIPFDIRDMEADRQAGLKTIPQVLSGNRSLAISYLCLLLSFALSVFHYQAPGSWFILFALGISAVTTFLFLRIPRIRKLPLYHYGILDGTMLLRGLLVWVFYSFSVHFHSG